MILFGKFMKRDSRRIDSHRLPVHIAIIPDGNGRWAARRGMPRNLGHREGANTFKSIAKYCNNLGIKYLTFYAFSTENWSRPKDEVDALMSLLLEFLRNADKELKGSNIRIRVVGDISRLTEELRSEIKRVIETTYSNTGLNLVFALNYGGRDEIVNAVRKIVQDVKKGVIKPEDINEQAVSCRLYTEGIPEPELLIRTSGEKRSSNFLLWQTAYTEFWYSSKLWPDFSQKDMNDAIIDYQSRNRRFGGV
jgi:undecaprenyl diphosphate synthase